MGHRLSVNDTDAASANDQVRLSVEALMELHRMTQVELAEQLGQSQPWLSKRLTGVTPFHLCDLDAIAGVFGLSPAQLLQSGHGHLDRRRAAQQRRSGLDRRQLGERFDSPRGRHRLLNP
jgi:transcriptional regulator with XRE-family HTH domain